MMRRIHGNGDVQIGRRVVPGFCLESQRTVFSSVLGPSMQYRGFMVRRHRLRVFGCHETAGLKEQAPLCAHDGDKQSVVMTQCFTQSPACVFCRIRIGQQLLDQVPLVQ